MLKVIFFDQEYCEFSERGLASKKCTRSQIFYTLLGVADFLGQFISRDLEKWLTAMSKTGSQLALAGLLVGIFRTFDYFSISARQPEVSPIIFSLKILIEYNTRITNGNKASVQSIVQVLPAIRLLALYIVSYGGLYGLRERISTFSGEDLDFAKWILKLESEVMDKTQESKLRQAQTPCN